MKKILGRETRKTETHRIGQVVWTENYSIGFREGETNFRFLEVEHLDGLQEWKTRIYRKCWKD